MAVATSWRHQYLDTLSNGFERLFKNELFTDTTLVAGPNTFKCHRSILSAVSPYFEAMFSSGMKESITGLVNVEGVPFLAVKEILIYIYCGCNIVRECNAEEILKGAALFQIECLQRQCEEFMCRDLSKSNCISRWRTAHWHGCIRLQDTAWAYMMEHFMDICKTDEFLAMEVDELIRILKDDNLHATDEECITDSAMRWVSHDQEHRTKHLPAIFNSLRICLTKPQYLADIVRKNEVLKECHEVHRIIDRAKNFQLLPSCRHNFSSEQMSPRKTSHIEDVLVVVSGAESHKPPYVRTKDVYAYSFNSRQWYHLAPLPEDPGIEFASCVYENDIFITGGGMMPTCFLRYRAKKNKWTQCRANLKTGRRRHAMISNGNKIYALGGFNPALEEKAKVLNSIEEYELDTGEWSEVGKLAFPISSVSASAFGDRIFIYGGEKSDRTECPLVQCYDTRLNSVSVVMSLPISCKLSRAIVCDNDTYLVLYDGKVVKHSTEECSTKIIGQMKNFDSVHFGMVHRRGIIYILGGQKIGGRPNQSLLDTMIRFDIRNSIAMTLQDRLPSPRFVDSCAKITINKKFLQRENIWNNPKSPL